MKVYLVLSVKGSYKYSGDFIIIRYKFINYTVDIFNVNDSCRNHSIESKISQS